MGFLGVFRAIYDYAPQSEGELQLTEGDVLYVIEKSTDDDWWKAKKKADAEDDDEPLGLIPNNYVEEVKPVGQARSLYEYTRQTDEELSFPEDAQLQVFDATDEDWVLVAYEGEFGFAPANYIEMVNAPSASARASPPPSLPGRPPAAPDRVVEAPSSPPLPPRQVSFVEDVAPPSPEAPAGPQAALAGVMAGRSAVRASPPSPIQTPSRQQYSESEEEPSPALPNRPRHQPTASIDAGIVSPPLRTSSRHYDDDTPSQAARIAPGGFHMYNINEMVSVMGKKKKMPTTLGVNLKTGVILIAPEHAEDGPSMEWTAEKMTHYSREGKHVFMELVKPSKSIDFHAGAKDTAEEIVSALGELSGAVRAEGLREVIAAGTGLIQKKGLVLYDFMAQGEDEVTVAVGDDVLVLDDTKSDEWWLVRRVKNSKEGVVPSSYVEIIETIKTSTTPAASASSGINAGKSHVAQNRLEEQRLTREALKKEPTGDSGSRRDGSKNESSRSQSSKSKPDPRKVRAWTDRSKSFSVEAQFLGLKDGKINLHKMNGVKIAVPVAKMSVEDIEYVEQVTGKSLDEDRPLSDVKRAAKSNQPSGSSSSSRQQQAKVGASIETPQSDYDWFQFFLSCEVALGLCERYAQAFIKDSMVESVLPDVDAGVLRNLGLREGDILKVMRYLDKRFGRDGKKKANEDSESNGGLFSGPGGSLRNNTRKGRPAPATQTSDVVDPKAFSQNKDGSADSSAASSPATNRPNAKGSAASGSNGFDDDAWDVKPSKQTEAPARPAQATPEPNPQAAAPSTQAMQELNLLSQPLEPTKAPPPTLTQPPAQPQAPLQPQQTQAQPLGATPSFFTGVAQQITGMQPMQTGTPAQPLGLGLAPRARPTVPQMTGAGLIAPPPGRALSAPQSAQPSAFNLPPMQPQVTGIAAPGQSLNDLTQQRMMMMMQQQQQQQNMGMFQPQQTGMSFNPGIMQQPTGFQPNQFMQPNMTGIPQMQQMPQGTFQQPQGQFPPINNQPTGFQGGFGQAPQQQFPQQTGVNSFLPQALEPDRTGMNQPMQPMQAQPTGAGFGGFTRVGGSGGVSGGYSNGTSQSPPPQLQPLQPQQTGPAPPVRFGVPEKLAPQATGRRANLSAATPDNPFGF
ncbi:actin cytoskeleton-regulatory complex protein SLA1 [Microdochium nivale]|nr:actin cytoskeleton-regulatory complex protein SLA1 [Microdochium nivale]